MKKMHLDRDKAIDMRPPFPLPPLLSFHSAFLFSFSPYPLLHLFFFLSLLSLLFSTSFPFFLLIFLFLHLFPLLSFQLFSPSPSPPLPFSLLSFLFLFFSSFTLITGQGYPRSRDLKHVTSHRRILGRCKSPVTVFDSLNLFPFYRLTTESNTKSRTTDKNKTKSLLENEIAMPLKNKYIN